MRRPFLAIESAILLFFDLLIRKLLNKGLLPSRPSLTFSREVFENPL